LPLAFYHATSDCTCTQWNLNMNTDALAPRSLSVQDILAHPTVKSYYKNAWASKKRLRHNGQSRTTPPNAFLIFKAVYDGNAKYAAEAWRNLPDEKKQVYIEATELVRESYTRMRTPTPPRSAVDISEENAPKKKRVHFQSKASSPRLDPPVMPAVNASTTTTVDPVLVTSATLETAAVKVCSLAWVVFGD
jgi:hypothetical protein